jgi:RNA polymerase sigma-70 factor, ECF subfamily
MRRDRLAQDMLAILGELTAFARSLTGADAADLVQETVRRSLAAANQLDDPRRLRAWMFRILRNAHVDALRAKAARDRFVVLEGGLEDLGEIEIPAFDAPSFDQHDLAKALALLPEAARTALLLSDLWGLDQDEIAEVLDVPVGTVKSRVARARARVAVMLADRRSVPGRRARDES